MSASFPNGGAGGALPPDWYKVTDKSLGEIDQTLTLLRSIKPSHGSPNRDLMEALNFRATALMSIVTSVKTQVDTLKILSDIADAKKKTEIDVVKMFATAIAGVVTFFEWGSVHEKGLYSVFRTWASSHSGIVEVSVIIFALVIILMVFYIWRRWTK